MDCNDSDPKMNYTLPRGGLRRSGSVYTFEYCVDKVFQATSAVAGSSFDEYVLSGPELQTLGPSIQDIVIHAEGSNFTAQFSYDVGLQYKYRNGPWSTTASLLGTRTTGAYAPSSVFNDRSKLGMAIRLVLMTQVASGSSTQHGNLSVAAAIRLFSC